LLAKNSELMLKDTQRADKEEEALPRGTYHCEKAILEGRGERNWISTIKERSP